MLLRFYLAHFYFPYSFELDNFLVKFGKYFLFLCFFVNPFHTHIYFWCPPVPATKWETEVQSTEKFAKDTTILLRFCVGRRRRVVSKPVAMTYFFFVTFGSQMTFDKVKHSPC